MYVHFNIEDKKYQADLTEPIPISLPLKDGAENPNCFWAPLPQFSPVVMGDFIGDTRKGGAVNFYDVRFNPHGNGTHTECVGHIAKERYYIHNTFKKFHFVAKLISILPQKISNGDRVITLEQIKNEEIEKGVEALIVRTLPNHETKKSMSYSGTNPPYVDSLALEYIALELGIEHFLIDLPSVDREQDGGSLLGHNAFWQYPNNTRLNCTISELIYVDNSIKDGLYLLQICVAPFELDVSPSLILLYKSDLIA
ncbi:MAG: cyclase family protein [Saprospiraceae bacterium]|nr:cyclase family protein [Saprospiraceae bacterium]